MEEHAEGSEDALVLESVPSFRRNLGILQVRRITGHDRAVASRLL